METRALRFLASALVSRTYSASPFFNPFLLPFSFYLTPLLPSYTALGDSFPFFLSPPTPRGGIFSFISVIPFIPPSRSTLTSLFVHSTYVRAGASFIVFVPRCPPHSRAPSAAPIPILVFHARKRALSYFPRLPFSRVRPASEIRRHPLRDIFRFPFRYVRPVSDT